MIENLHFKDVTNDQEIDMGVAGFPKDGARSFERPMQGRAAEPWMASVVAMSLKPSESTPREELSTDDKRLMADLRFAWKALIGKYKVPIEHAIDEMNKALVNGETSIDVLAGYSKTGAPLLDPSKANIMLDEIRKSIETNSQLSGRLRCGDTYSKDRYRRFTITIQKVGV